MVGDGIAAAAGAARVAQGKYSPAERAAVETDERLSGNSAERPRKSPRQVRTTEPRASLTL